MTRSVTLEFYPGAYKFSAGHFTIFSPTERERLHGHNYLIAATVTAAIREPGLTFDYAIFKNRLKAICEKLDRRFLLPENSPYLQIEEDEHYYYATFNHEKIPFLKNDVLLLPVENTTLEDLSQWAVNEIISDQKFIRDHAISAMTIKVFNGPEQSAGADYRRDAV